MKLSNIRFRIKVWKLTRNLEKLHQDQRKKLLAEVYPRLSKSLQYRADTLKTRNQDICKCGRRNGAVSQD